MVSEMIVRF